MCWPRLLRVLLKPGAGVEGGGQRLGGESRVQEEVWGLLKQVLTFGHGTIFRKYCL